MIRALCLLLLAGCAAGSRYDEPTPLAHQRLTVTNDGLDILVITELPNGRGRVSVYPGETRSWPTYGSGQRQLLVRIGTRTYLSGIFSQGIGECFRLTVDTAPHLTIPVGPWPDPDCK